MNQVELHVFHQKQADQDYMASKGIQIESWGAFAEGKFDVFTNPVLKEIAGKYGKSTAQVMLRWQLQRGVVSLSKSANPERVRQNFDILISNSLLMIWQKLLPSTQVRPFMLPPRCANN